MSLRAAGAAISPLPGLLRHFAPRNDRKKKLLARTGEKGLLARTDKKEPRNSRKKEPHDGKKRAVVMTRQERGVAMTAPKESRKDNTKKLQITEKEPNKNKTKNLGKGRQGNFFMTPFGYRSPSLHRSPERRRRNHSIARQRRMIEKLPPVAHKGSRRSSTTRFTSLAAPASTSLRRSSL